MQKLQGENSMDFNLNTENTITFNNKEGVKLGILFLDNGKVYFSGDEILSANILSKEVDRQLQGSSDSDHKKLIFSLLLNAEHFRFVLSNGALTFTGFLDESACSFLQYTCEVFNYENKKNQ